MNPPSQTPVLVSVIVTLILLLLVGIVSMFGQVVLLNGVISDRQTGTALGIDLGCNGLTIILAAMFARWLTKLLLGKANWPPFPSAAVAVIVSVGLGIFFSFLSIIVGTMAAGIR
ncbi:MAG: hypothetical protein AB1564_02910 [Chloroflexota bacterium]